MRCNKCGKDIVEYKEKREYYSPKLRGYIVEYICKDCYVDLGEKYGDLND